MRALEFAPSTSRASRLIRALRGVLFVAPIAATLIAGAPSHAAKITECTEIKLCYCVNDELKPLIDEKIKRYRGQIAEARAAGKAIGYLSLPLSTLGGGYFNVNAEVGSATKQRVEARFGAGSVWVLNPGEKESDLSLPSGTRGANDDYMLMWTRVLEGLTANGEDFDFVYFAGPSDFAAYFGLTGTGDMDRLGTFFDERVAKDAGLKREVERGRVTRNTFRNYYGLKASVSFSNGAHEEWNIFRTLNERRRANAKFGVANQIAVFFDGKAVATGAAESAVAMGVSGACKLP
ncbi:MAG TPA: hypothetical protein PK586_10785 [Casimicrobium sp.]|nr:hypothetical protein [Casimicrobium sp.]